MFIAVAKLPANPTAIQQAAAIAGIAVADASRLLAGVLPRVLVRATSEGPRIVEALTKAGFVAFIGEESSIPSDKDRVVARNLELLPNGLVAVDGRGQRFECPANAITAFIRGIRLVESTEVTKTTERKLDIGKTLMTGLPITKKVTTESSRTNATKEAFILIQCRGGLPEIILYEHKLNYQCLGSGIQPSTFGNQMALLARLRALASQAPMDDRITRPGYLTGLPALAVDPVDLAVFIVSRARSLGC
jgi:hypothetical protein